MKRLAAALIPVLLVTATMAAVVRADSSHPAPWRWKTVAAPPQALSSGNQADIVITCPSGYAPVSLEWHLDNNWANVYFLIRQAEYLDYTGNWGRLLFYNPNTVTRTIYATLNCVNGDDIGTVSVTSHDFTAASGGGFVACPVLTKAMIGGGADWSSYENGRSIDFSAPTSSGWYASGQGGSGTLHVEVYCIDLALQSGMGHVQHRETAISASVKCPTDQRVVSGGGYAYAVGGSVDPSAAKGFLVAVDQLRLSTGEVDIRADITSGTASTWLVAWALCAPVSHPSLDVTLAPSGDQASSDASYAFMATDQAGEALRYNCYLDTNSGYPCLPSTTNTISGLAEGNHSLLIEARNDSNVTDTKSFSFRVDRTAPTAILMAPTIPFTQVASTIVRWTGSDSLTGIATWQVEWRQAPYIGVFGPWSAPQNFPAATLSKTSTGLTAGYDSCYRVRAIDGVGNSSDFSAVRCTARLLDDRTLAASAGWTQSADTAAYGGTVTSTTRRNATLTLTGAQLDRLALLATTCPTCGKVSLNVNGKLVGTIDLQTTSTHARQLIQLPPFSYRSGTVTLKVLTSGLLVRIDGLGISRT